MHPVTTFEVCKDIQAASWLRVAPGWTPGALRGKPVALFAFQMLCPACVSHSLPQARRLARLFEPEQLAVIGLHTVFEHHEAMSPVALTAFLHEYRVDFPVAIDRHAPGQPMPETMRLLQLKGTPSLVLLDAQGRVVLNHFGAMDDLALGTLIGRLVSSAPDA